MFLVVRSKFEVTFYVVRFALALDAKRSLAFLGAIRTLMIVAAVSAHQHPAVANPVVSSTLKAYLFRFSLDCIHVLLQV